jgi:hypothetical protein
LYLVCSKVMEEAVNKRGGYVDGTVGVLDEDEDDSEPLEGKVLRIESPRIRRQTRTELWCAVLATILAIAAFVSPYVAIVGFTKFQSKGSSLEQRAWIISWIVSGQTVWLFWAAQWLLRDWYKGHTEKELAMFSYVNFVVWGLFLTPAIGGFVCIGKMIKDFGNCVEV